MVAKTHAMVEVPVRYILNDKERKELSAEEQTRLQNKRLGNIQQSLYMNYRTRHMANRMIAVGGVLYVRRSYHSVMRAA